MVTATYEVMVDWTGDGVFGDANEDITGDVLRMEWFMGRDYPSMLNGRSRGGRAFITLDNDSNNGKYSSFNTASAIYPNVLPGRKVRIRATDATGTVTLWQGFLDRINPQVQVNGINTALLEAIGPLGWLARADFELFLGLNTDQLSGTVIGDLLDAVAWPAGDRDIDAGQSTIKIYDFGREGTFGTRERKINAVTAMHKVGDTENGFLHEGKTGTVIFESRDRRLQAPYTTSQVTISDSPGGGEITYGRITQGDPLKQIFNLFTTTIQHYTVGAIQVISTHPEAVASHAYQLSIEPGETYSVDARPPLDAVYELVSTWTTLAATTDYITNSQADGLGTDLTASMGVTQTPLGQSLFISITNNHASSTAYLTLLQARGQPLNFDNPLLILAPLPSGGDAIDALGRASQTKYGMRQFPVPASMVRDSEEGRDHVRWLLSVYAEPRPQIDVLIHANKDADHLSHALRRSVSDQITIDADSIRTDLGLTAHPLFIESLHHVVNSKFEHTVEWSCSSLEAVEPFWALDTCKFDTTTAFHY